MSTRSARCMVSLVVRPRPWRQLPTVLLMIAINVIVVWVWVINVRPDKNVGFPAVLALIWGIYLVEAARCRIIVDNGQVCMISVHRDPPVSCDQVAHIRALRWNVVLYDQERKPLLEVRGDLTRAQLLALGHELGVPVWDHRAWYGLKEMKHGVRLNPEPFANRPST